MLALVDYKGFRMIACSVLPIKKTTICYGSCDSGKTVHASNPHFNSKMKKIAQFLNIAPHQCGSQIMYVFCISNLYLYIYIFIFMYLYIYIYIYIYIIIFIFTFLYSYISFYIILIINTALIFINSYMKKRYSAADLEGHLGEDNRCYLVDFGRAEGPQEAPLTTPTTVADRRKIFYHLLRPELVRSHSKPLNPDGMSMWSRSEPQKHEMNVEIARCTLRLIESVIPRFATVTLASLEQSLYEEDLQDESLFHDIVELSHRHGINLRHWGRVRASLQGLNTPIIQNVLLHEMAARLLKNVLRRKQRMFALRKRDVSIQDRRAMGVSDRAFKSLAVRHANLILCKATGYQIFWEAVKQGLITKYPLVLTADEAEAPLYSILRYDILFMRLLTMIGFDLSPQAARQLRLDPSSFSFVVSDFPDQIRAVSKQMNVIEHSEAMELFYQSFEHEAGSVKKRLLALANQKFQRAVARAPSATSVLVSWGLLCFERANFLT